MKNKIVLIGGVAGTGKTTIAKELAYRYGFYHRLGTGFIREIVKTETKNPVLDSHTYVMSSKQAYHHLVDQTLVLKDSINACINRANDEGTSIVLEGNHLIPWVLENPNVTHSIILYVDDKEKHWKLLNGKSHKERFISDDDFKRVREMQYSLICLAEKNGVHLIESGKDMNRVFYDIEKVIKDD